MKKTTNGCEKKSGGKVALSTNEQCPITNSPLDSSAQGMPRLACGSTARSGAPKKRERGNSQIASFCSGWFVYLMHWLNRMELPAPYSAHPSDN